MMDRRAFISLVGGIILATPLAAIWFGEVGCTCLI
jgi:hypothetical protein